MIKLLSSFLLNLLIVTIFTNSLDSLKIVHSCIRRWLPCWLLRYNTIFLHFTLLLNSKLTWLRCLLHFLIFFKIIVVGVGVVVVVGCVLFLFLWRTRLLHIFVIRLKQSEFFFNSDSLSIFSSLFLSDSKLFFFLFSSKLS